MAASHSQKNADKAADAASQRFIIHPNDITLAVNQTQVFGVTDANGKVISVRWKISGVGCATSASACGTIDGNGAYVAPQSVSRPLVVMLEGIPVSDAEYPAFARIQLEPGSAPSAVPSSIPVSAQAASIPRPERVEAPKESVDAQPTAVAIIEQPGSAVISQPGAPPLQPVADSSASQRSVVTYKHGQLTIDATNETLAGVLRMVSEKTGAIIDVPPGTGLERIVEHAGPAPTSDVLTQLLKGSHFNFVMVGSPQHPNELHQVLLAPRAESEPAVIAAAPAPTPPAVEPEPPQAQDGSGVFTGNGLTPPDHKLSRDELRDFLKERARQVRGDAQPDTQPK